MNVAKSVTGFTVIDPDTKGEVEISVFKDMSSGGMFAIDTSWLLEFDDDVEIRVPSPFNDEELLLVEEDGKTEI
jgi:hypothetical protein